MIRLTQWEFDAAQRDHQGFCAQCKEFTRDSTEPDAEGYKCPQCNQYVVMGAELALLAGELWVTD